MSSTCSPSPLAAPQISRAQWRSHPRFSRQALLLRSHEGFRGRSRWLIHLAERRDTDLAWIERSFHQWMWGMRSHEAYEEGKLYPYLTCRYGISMEDLEAGHHELSRLRRKVFGALDVRDRQELHAALVEFDTELVDHLRKEEDVVIPLLLGLSPEEFEAYYVSTPSEALERVGCG